MSPDLHNDNFSELYVEKSRPKICVFICMEKQEISFSPQKHNIGRYRKCVLLFYNITSSFIYFSPPTMLLVMDRFPESSKNFIFKLKSRTSLFYPNSFDKYLVFWKIFRRPEIWVSGNWSVTTKMQFTLTFINHKNTKDLLTENVRYYTID